MNATLFEDNSTDIEKLVEQALSNPIDLPLRMASVDDTPQAASGENWAPHLAPYKTWKPGKRNDGLGLLEAGNLDQSMDAASRRYALEQGLAAAASESVVRLDGEPDTESQPMISARKGEAGWTIVEFNLHKWVRNLGHAVHDAVVVVPASIDGQPVVGLAANAFRPRQVNGIGVRLLVLPEGLLRVADDALSALSVRTVYLSETIEEFGAQRFSGGSASSAPCISFIVDPSNPRFESNEGSLLTADGSSLLFQRYPYPAVLTLAQGVRRVGPGAWVRGVPGPECVVCPATLETVESQPNPDLLWNPDTLWACEHGSDLERRMNTGRPVALGRDFVRTEEGLYFDIDGMQAELVGSPATMDTITVPAQVKGLPVTAVREGALPRRVGSLSLSDGIQRIGPRNPCTGLHTLQLPAALESVGEGSFRSRSVRHIVEIPASVREIGRGCFEGLLCRLERCDAVVRVPSDVMLSCFLEGEAAAEAGLPFDFRAYDGWLLSGRHVPDKVGALLARLQTPFALSDADRDAMTAVLREREAETLDQVARAGDPQQLEVLAEAGFFTEDNIDRASDLMRRAQRTDCALFLMAYRRDHFAQAPDLHTRFSL